MTPYDVLQPTVTSGNTYVAPADGAITSWSHNAGAGANQTLALKMFRRVSGSTYIVVGHDGPRELTPSTLNTFSGISIPIAAGDILGFNDYDTVACAFVVPGDSILELIGNLPDGGSGTFDPRTDVRANITALLEPDCDKDGLGDETQDSQFTGSPPCPEVRCGGALATIVGTNANNEIVGTAGRDVIDSLGGNDKVTGLGGKDLICGGAGKDKLNGGGGKDTLLGQGGKDTLKGGGAKDVCKGGKGNDSATCEVEKSI